MDDYSLVPVEHQPDFENVSLVPVDHDPFGDGDPATQQAHTLSPQTQSQVQQAQFQQPPAQPQPPQPEQQTQPQQPATGVARLYVGRPANTQASEADESWNPDTGNSGTSGLDRSAASAPVQDRPTYDWSHFNQSFGELKPAIFAPTQQIGNFAADALMAAGMQPYTANDLTKRISNLLGFTPLGAAGSALDLIDAKRRGDPSGVVAAAAGMIPGAKGGARAIAELHHAWPKYLGGLVKQDLVPLPKSLHHAFHRALDASLPRWRGKAYYESMGPAERQQALQALATCTKKFDAAHGTKLYDALLKNGFPAP